MTSKKCNDHKFSNLFVIFLNSFCWRTYYYNHNCAFELTDFIFETDIFLNSEKTYCVHLYICLFQSIELPPPPPKKKQETDAN